MHAPNTTARHPTKNTIPDLRLYIHALWRSTKQFLISAILYRGGTEKNLGTWWKLWITTVAVIQKKHHHQKTNIWIHINQRPKSWIIWLPLGPRYSTTFTTPFWNIKKWFHWNTIKVCTETGMSPAIAACLNIDLLFHVNVFTRRGPHSQTT